MTVNKKNNKVIPFPEPFAPEPEPISKGHQRVILSIGGQRLAFDFNHEVTKLNPAPAPVLPINRDRPGKRGKLSKPSK